MKKILLICTVLLCSFSSKGWIDSVYWNRAVLPHTIRTIWSMNQGTHIKYIDQYFPSGSDTLQIDYVFNDCSGPASLYDWDSTINIPSSISKPNYCVIVRIIFDSNSILNNCYVHDRLIDTNYVDCNAPLSISEIGGDKVEIKMFPNPVKNKLNIEIFGNTKSHTIYLFNLFGILIRKEKYQSDLDVSELATGIYLIAVQTDDGLIWSKFLKE